MALKYLDVCVLIYTYDREHQAWVFPTEAECRKQLVSIVKEKWNEAFGDLEEPMPKDELELVNAYFADAPDEAYTILRSS